MSTAVLLALVLCYVCVQQAVAIIPSLDVARPLVRFSPTRDETDSLYADDGFGYSAAIHHTVDDLSGLTLEEVLNQVRIIAGSPRGRFPGGFDSMFPTELLDMEVCNRAEHDAAGDSDVFDGQIPDITRECFGVTGLVYMCNLTNDLCIPFLGNGEKDSPDGYLYKRNPNLVLRDNYEEYSNGGLMGATMFSTGDYFVACAPRFYYSRDTNNGLTYEPRGRCVFSGRSLQGFKILDPCSVESGAVGSATNQIDFGFCQAGSSVLITESAKILLGTPGYSFSIGGLGVYDDLSGVGSTLTTPMGNAVLPSGIPALSQPPDRYSDVTFSYFGSSLAVGNFSGSEGFASSAVRYQPIENQPGSISFINSFGTMDVTDIFNLTYTLGNQLGESFGKALLAADLNGDGFDELLVAAPTYSESQNPEVGRVYILRNVDQGTSFELASNLTGFTKLGRFGHAITSLGDLNNDGFEDIAVGAPYENDKGKVYIYYGSDTASCINTTPQQIITAEDMESRVSGLGSLQTFGAFLQGNADIDNNQYQDLLIGAEQSQAVFVLRSIPMARVNITVTANVTEIEILTVERCRLGSNMYPCFQLTVRGNYTGKGLEGFSARYTVREEVGNMQQPRLIFEDKITTLDFTGEGIEASSSLIAYVTSTASGNLDDLVVTVTMDQFERPTEQVDSSLQFTDLSTEPIIESEPAQTSVNLLIDCGQDGICNSDVSLKVINVTYLDDNDNPYSDQSRLTVGVISEMKLLLEISNLNETARALQLNLTLPLEFSLFNPEEVGITCQPDENMQNLNVCTIFQALLPGQSKTFSWNLGVNVDLVGDEGSLIITANVGIIERPLNVEPLDRLDNNQVIVDIPVVAASVYTVEMTYTSTLTYEVSRERPQVNQTNQLGTPVQITVVFTNTGPSTLPGVRLNIYLPLRNMTDTGDFYYLYPVAITPEAGIECFAPFDVNPDGLIVAQKRRKRRSLQKGVPVTMNSLLRSARQSSPDITYDCSTTPSPCMPITCTSQDSLVPGQFGVSTTIEIQAYIDNRFFFDKEERYVLTSFVSVQKIDGDFVDTTGSTESVSTTVTISMLPDTTISTAIPVWVIIVCIIAGILFFFIVAVVLGLLIILHIQRRKKRGEHEMADEEVEEYNQKAFDNDAEKL